MLSRVARRIYWLARYIERAENTARLVNTYHFLLLDLPRGTRVGWEALSVITGSYALFAEHYQRHDERNMVKFLLADSFNPGSLLNSISSARENARTSREILPGQAWEQINELQLFATAHVNDALPRHGRFEFLTEIIQRCQQLTGMLSGTMTHDHAYDFVRIGRNIERAEMTTRVIDIGAMSLQNPNESGSLDVHVWTSMLRALSAYQMYRKDVRHGVHCADVVGYLLQNDYLPRSVAFCLDQIEECVGDLPLHKDTLKPLREVRRRVTRIKPGKLDAASLHTEVDQMQIGISEVHRQIRKTWFA
ncbi:MAG: alpha-E domain-containing protein [Gammaproteobacteria bacterium]